MKLDWTTATGGALVGLLIAAFAGIPAAIAQEGGDTEPPECHKCWDDFDEPPPSAPNCSQWGYRPACWRCTGWEPECKRGSVNECAAPYYEDFHYCGQQCAVGDDDPCEPHHRLLDGTALLTTVANGTFTSEVDRTAGDDVLYRDHCNGAVLARRYTPVTSEEVARSLIVLRL